jgi:hypothetical protein
MTKKQLEDSVEPAFFQENGDSYKAISPSVSFIILKNVLDAADSKLSDVREDSPVIQEPFTGTGREERLEVQFGLWVDNDRSLFSRGTQKIYWKINAANQHAR